MTLYNDITRRPHLPREPAIRRILSYTGLDLALYGRSSAEDLEAADEEHALLEGDEAGECEEEEELEADPCI